MKVMILVVSTLRCGRNNPGSNPGHGKAILFFFFFSRIVGWKLKIQLSRLTLIILACFWMIVIFIIESLHRTIILQYSKVTKNNGSFSESAGWFDALIFSYKLSWRLLIICLIWIFLHYFYMPYCKMLIEYRR